MQHKPPILPNHYYHIYNRGNNGSQIFFRDEDFSHFIQLMKIFLVPISDIYSYALMTNHIHIAIRIRNDDEIGWLDPLHASSEDMVEKWSTSFDILMRNNNYARKPSPIRMLQHLFSHILSGSTHTITEQATCWKIDLKGGS